MSVSLVVNWPDGRFEDVPIASQRGGEWWGQVGYELGLELVPHFHSFIAVEPDRLDQFINEVTTFRRFIATQGTGYEQTLEAANRLLAAFRRLKQSQGWTASIG